nr:MAG TPA: hypothetical protein [Caudoviricetes sp.]
MRIVNVPRGDLSVLYHSNVNMGDISGMGNMSQENLYTGVFGNYMQELNAYYQSDQYLQLAQELTMMQSTSDLDISIYLINNDDIAVGKMMQTYIMASPYVAKAYDTGLITGFHYGYPTDSHFGYTDRHKYLQVMDGVLEEGNDEYYYSTEYYTADDTPLDFEQQLDITNTWEYLKQQILRGIDPTDK